MFKNYLITAVRNIRRHKLYAFINILGLAMGLSVFMLIALFIQFELGYDKFHENHDRIYRIEQNKDLGFNSDHILIIHTKNTTPEINKFFCSQILQHSNVKKAGVSDYLPYNSSNWTGFSWKGAADNQGIAVNINYEERKTSKVIFYLAILAIFIACLGLFGLASFSIRQRAKEIGIRKALGATVPNIVSYLIAGFLKLLIIANFLAWPAAYIVMNYWLQNFPYRIEIQISVFIIAGALAFIIALITVLYQALKAAMANPVDALRYE